MQTSAPSLTGDRALFHELAFRRGILYIGVGGTLSLGIALAGAGETDGQEIFLGPQFV